MLSERMLAREFERGRYAGYQDVVDYLDADSRVAHKIRKAILLKTGIL